MISKLRWRLNRTVQLGIARVTALSSKTDVTPKSKVKLKYKWLLFRKVLANVTIIRST